MKVIKRDGQRVDFDVKRIQLAITRAMLEVDGESANVERVHQDGERIANTVAKEMLLRSERDGLTTISVEAIQDQVELALMRAEQYKVARAYILYRETQALARKTDSETDPQIYLIGRNGEKVLFDLEMLRAIVTDACAGFDEVDPELIIADVQKSIFNGMNAVDINELLVMSSRTLIEKDPAYSYVAASLLLNNLREDAMTHVYGKPTSPGRAEMVSLYPEYFADYIQKGVEIEMLDSRFMEYDLVALGKALKPSRDKKFTYLSLQTLYDRYFLHQDGVRFELPQAFFMRVAMGLAMNEDDRTARSIEFYNTISTFDFMSSTPTLFNSGTLRPQLSSCYLTTVPDDLGGIYDGIRDNAMLSKFAGGLGNDWTQVRSMGAHIKGTNGESQGVIPFLKVANDTAVAVNQGGKRKGAVCAYLETWHMDIEEFLDLRKNTGDERRRTHDMNTANWIPDLFMERVYLDKEWTLFSPNDVPDLHDLTGRKFASAYSAYEKRAKAGEIKARTIKAIDLWRKMLSMLFETGHPWITFKDPCNIRYTNNHVGVVHSSNLCTEITLHTNQDEIAVCNLGSVNLPRHIVNGKLDIEKLQRTIKTAMRMLDNVIEYNYYAVDKARDSNLQHRPVGLGIMGFHDALYKLGIAFESSKAVRFADNSMEVISYYAIEASMELAKERSPYPTFEGSLWSKGILPIDSIELLRKSRGDYLTMDTSMNMELDWDQLRRLVKKHGMRNSNTMAIAPTATISNICGVSQSIEPTFENLFVKSNLSGEFTVVNEYLVRDLKKLGLWDELMINDLKYFDGSVQQIDRVPDLLKLRYKTAFDIDPEYIIESASRRQKWLDQAQSLNLYLAKPSGPKLNNMYMLAWLKGLKTTYYLRSLGATAAEKTSQGPSVIEEPKLCGMDEEICEACQ